MNKENTERLLKKYPKLYRQYHLSAGESCMCWGFPGDGWYDIIDRLSEKLMAFKSDIDLEATQVKEKFGSLNFYLNYYNDEIDTVLGDASAESVRTCEICGAPGKMRDNGWMRCKCDRCQEEDRKIKIEYKEINNE